MRLGNYPCLLKEGSKIHKLYNQKKELLADNSSLLTSERHRHRFEFNNHYRQEFEEN